MESGREVNSGTGKVPGWGEQGGWSGREGSEVGRVRWAKWVEGTVKGVVECHTPMEIKKTTNTGTPMRLGV